MSEIRTSPNLRHPSLVDFIFQYQTEIHSSIDKVKLSDPQQFKNLKETTFEAMSNVWTVM